MAAATALPGPHIDLVAEMARWFDRWLRGADTGIGASGDDPGGEPSIVYFGRTSPQDPPEPDAIVVAGAWHGETTWPSPRLSTVEHRLTGGVVAHRLRPDTGTAAWNSCAGTLPYGQPTDQRFADAASLTWDVVVTEPTELLGHAVLALRVAADRPVASVVGAAVRRGAGRHLDPDHPRAPQPDPRRSPRRQRRPATVDARRVRRRRGRAGGDRLTPCFPATGCGSP